MATATNQQVQNYSDTVIRPFCEQARALKLAAQNIKATIGDVYANVSGASTWTDNRTDGPPHLAAPSDITAINTVVTDFLTWQAAEAQWPILEDLCVRPVTG